MRDTPSLATYAGRWPFRPVAGLARPCPYTELALESLEDRDAGVLLDRLPARMPGKDLSKQAKSRFGLQSRALVGVRELSLASPRNLTGIGSSVVEGGTCYAFSVALSPFPEIGRDTAPRVTGGYVFQASV